MLETKTTPDQDVIVSEIDILAPPERVFKAISDAQDIRRRSPQLSVYEMDVRVGGRWRLEIPMPNPHHGVEVIRHEGEILEVEPPRLLVYTWNANFHKNPQGKSIVRWELTPTQSGTHLKVTHSDLRPEPEAARDYAAGWPGVLEEIKNSVESGEKR